MGFLFCFVREHPWHLSSVMLPSLIKSSLSTLGNKRTGSLFKQGNFSALELSKVENKLRIIPVNSAMQFLNKKEGANF